MKKKVIQILLIGCLLLVTALGGCQGKTQYTTATPEGTVRLLFDAQCKLDAKKAAQCYAKEDREWKQEQFERAFDQYYSSSLDYIQTKVLFQTENEAEVAVQVSITHINYYIEKDGVVKIWEPGDDKLKRFPNFEMPSGGDSFFTFSLVKQGGEWLIKV